MWPLTKTGAKDQTYHGHGWAIDATGSENDKS